VGSDKMTLIPATFADSRRRRNVVRHSTGTVVSENHRHIHLDLSFEHVHNLQAKSVQASVDEPDGLRARSYGYVFESVRSEQVKVEENLSALATVCHLRQ
jgi:hypothetical protein